MSGYYIATKHQLNFSTKLKRNMHVIYTAKYAIKIEIITKNMHVK